MEIRKAARNDINNIAKLMLEEFKKPPFNEKVNIKQVVKSLNFYFRIAEIYVVTIKNIIIGVIVFKVEQYWEGQAIIIEDLAVDNKYKKIGAGKTLLDFIKEYAKKHNIKLIWFCTNKKSPAVKFYLKQGYKFRKDLVYMEKKIR